MELPLRILSVAYPEGSVAATRFTLAPDRKSLVLSDHTSIACRRIDDLPSISVVPEGEGSTGLTLQWPDLQDYVRIYQRLDGVLAGHKDPTIVATARIKIALYPMENDLTCNWVAVLRRERNGPFLFHRHIDKNINFTSSKGERDWDFPLNTIEASPETSYFLALQLPASRSHFQLLHFGLRIVAIQSERGELTSSIPSFVEGWSAADEASVEVVDRWGDPVWAQPVDRGRFTLATRRDTGCKAMPAAARLTAGGACLAYLDLAADEGATDNETDAPPSGLSAEQVERLYDERRVELLWMLSDAAQQHDSQKTSSQDEQYALDLFQSRALLGLAAAESAYKGLKAALSDESRFATLSAGTQRRMRLSFARACMRSGRRHEAEMVLHSMEAVDPLDWEIYFNLATLISPLKASLRDSYLRIMESLNPNLPTSAITLMLEDQLTTQCTEDAWIRALKEIKQRGAKGHALWLSLANVHLARGDSINWAASISRYFTEHDLSPPHLEAPCAPGGSVFERMSGATRPNQMQDGQPLVTVVMTAFNAERTVRTAIQSVLTQSYSNLHLIVVDDQSTDSTLAILNEMQSLDARVKIIRTPFNVGTYCAKNIALTTCRSDYITFHDADDWMHPERIATHVETMRSDPRLVCTISQWFRMDDTGAVKVRPWGGYGDDNAASTFIHGSLIAHIGYFDCVRAAADTEFLWRIRRRFGDVGVKFITKPLGIGRYHASSLTRFGTAAFDEFRYSAPRLEYLESWVEWHRRCVVGTGGGQALYLPFPHHPRMFEAPAEILTEHAERLTPDPINICGNEPSPHLI